MIDLTEIANERDKDFHLREDIFGDKTIPSQVVESLRKVIDYTYHDEEEHYEGTAYQSNHIFPHIHRLDEWVKMLEVA